MLSRFVAESYETILEVSMWLLLVASFFIGFSLNGIIGGVIFSIFTFIVLVVLFGALFILIDIRKILLSIDRKNVM